MKHLLIVGLIFFSMLLNAMNNCVALPGDVTSYILALSCSSLDLFTRKDKKIISRLDDEAEYEDIKKNLPIIAQKIIELRCMSGQSNEFIAQNIASILCLNEINRDDFLIRSLQANVPYFVTCALVHGADSNAIHKPSGFTALLCATESNNYGACKLLLSKGANINLKMRRPEVLGYGYSASYNWPIHMTVKNGDTRLVMLFAQVGAKLNVRINNERTYSLLSVAVGRNDPEILKVLLEFGTDADYRDIGGPGGKHGIEIALEEAIEKRNNEHDVEERYKNKQIIELLERALEQRNML